MDETPAHHCHPVHVLPLIILVPTFTADGSIAYGDSVAPCSGQNAWHVIVARSTSISICAV